MSTPAQRLRRDSDPIDPDLSEERQAWEELFRQACLLAQEALWSASRRARRPAQLGLPEEEAWAERQRRVEEYRRRVNERGSIWEDAPAA